MQWTGLNWVLLFIMFTPFPALAHHHPFIASPPRQFLHHHFLLSNSSESLSSSPSNTHEIVNPTLSITTNLRLLDREDKNNHYSHAIPISHLPALNLNHPSLFSLRTFIVLTLPQAKPSRKKPYTLRILHSSRVQKSSSLHTLFHHQLIFFSHPYHTCIKTKNSVHAHCYQLKDFIVHHPRVAVMQHSHIQQNTQIPHNNPTQNKNGGDELQSLWHLSLSRKRRVEDWGRMAADVHAGGSWNHWRQYLGSWTSWSWRGLVQTLSWMRWRSGGGDAGQRFARGGEKGDRKNICIRYNNTIYWSMS